MLALSSERKLLLLSWKLRKNKHSGKRKLRKEIRKIRTTLKRRLTLSVLNTVFHQLNVALKSKLKVVTSRHQNKLSNLRKQEKAKTIESKIHYIKKTVHNFSSYQLSTDEYTALSYGLDHHIPTRLNNNRIHTEFEQFYEGILKEISHLPENYLSSLKTKLRNICQKYSKIHVPYKYKKIIDELSGNKDLCILKQDKGSGVMLMDKTKYTKKCLEILETNQFPKLNHVLQRY